MLLVDDSDQCGRILLELAEQRCEQELADLEPFLGPIAQLDELEHAVGLVGEPRKGWAPCRPHHGDVVTEAAKLVLHQLAVLFAEPIVVAMQQVTKLDVVKTSVIAL